MSKMCRFKFKLYVYILNLLILYVYTIILILYLLSVLSVYKNTNRQDDINEPLINFLCILTFYN